MKKALYFLTVCLVIILFGWIGYNLYQIAEWSPSHYVYYEKNGYTVKEWQGPGIMFHFDFERKIREWDRNQRKKKIEEMK
jgi:hypothetical protein